MMMELGRTQYANKYSTLFSVCLLEEEEKKNDAERSSIFYMAEVSFKV